MRNPAVVRPPVAISGKRSDLSKTIVSGPGQQLEAKTFAIGGINSDNAYKDPI
jgi:hypothetical protein